MLSIRHGFVTNIDENGWVRVQFPDIDNFTSDFMPTIKSKSKNDKDGNFLDIDEEVTAIYDEENDEGVVLGARNSEASPLAISDRNKKYFTFSDGTHIEYDKASHILMADVNGTAVIKATTVTVNGDLIVTGNVSDKKGSMQQIRDTYNDHTNPSGGVTPQKM